MCCPAGTSYNETTCTCEADEFCFDECGQVTVPFVNATSPVPEFNETHCTDNYGNVLSPADSADQFVVHDGDQTYTLFCAPGSLFDLEACACGKFVEPSNDTATPASTGRCSVYLPFDTDLNDYSALKINTYPYGNVQQSVVESYHGSGSAYFDGGRIEIPSTKSLDLGSAASWCLAFKQDTNSSDGGMLSNSNSAESTEFGLILASINDQLSAFMQLSTSVSHELSGEFQLGEWNQVCVVFTGNMVELYVNNVSFEL